MTEVSLIEVNPDTELRKLNGAFMYELFRILDHRQSWEELMTEIRLDCFNLDDDRRKYTYRDVRTIAEAADDRRSCAEIFLDEWGTSGEKRPTVQLLYDYVKRIGLIKAANYIGTNYLKIPAIVEPLELPVPPSADVDENTVKVPDSVEPRPQVDDSHHHRSTMECGENRLQNIEGTDESRSEEFPTIINTAVTEVEVRSKLNALIDKGGIERIPYEVLKTCTQNFAVNCKLGEGAFGCVYRFSTQDTTRAVKVLRNFAMENFERELTILSSSVRHRRLLTPVAVSIDDVPCLIYPYMSHGSLEDRLALKFSASWPLGWQKRIMIAGHIIEGLSYLHGRPQPILHRDIKSANILLDGADVAHIGDFGLIREKTVTQTSMISTVQGTDAYMAPEARLFRSTTQSDVFSYGMVLLELLTGLTIVNEERGHLMHFIEDYVEDNGSIIGLLDSKAGEWCPKVAEELYHIAEGCLVSNQKKRSDTVTVEKAVNDLIGIMVTR